MNRKDRAVLLLSLIVMPIILSYLISPALQQPAVLFLKSWGGIYSDYGGQVAVDSDGNIYVSATTSSFVHNPPRASYPVLLKYNSAGILKWQKEFINTSTTSTTFNGARGVAVDSSGNIYLTGWQSTDALLLKFNSTGILTWQRELEAGGLRAVGSGVAVDYASGGVYVAGEIDGYGNSAFVFLLKFNSTGSMLWERSWSRTVHDVASSVAVDKSHNVYVAGSTEDTGKTALLLLKFDSSGNLLRFDSFGNLVPSEYEWRGAADVAAYHVVIDDSDNVYVTGCEKAAGSSLGHGVLLKFQEDGYLKQKQWRSGGNDCSYGDAVDLSDNVYVAGNTVSVGGVYNAYLMKFNQDLTLEWQKTLLETSSKYGGGLGWTQPSGNITDAVSDLALDSSGNLFVSGSLAESPQFTLGLGSYNISDTSIRYNVLTENASKLSLETFTDRGSYRNITGSESPSGSEHAFLLKLGESSSIFIDTTLVLAILTAAPILLLRRRIFG